MRLLIEGLLIEIFGWYTHDFLLSKLGYCHGTWKAREINTKPWWVATTTWITALDEVEWRKHSEDVNRFRRPNGGVRVYEHPDLIEYYGQKTASPV